MKLARRLVLAVVALALAGVMVWAYLPQPVAVSVAAVTRGPLQVVVEEDGRTRLRERYVVTPPVTGFLRRLALHAGDSVSAGQALFELEPLPAGALDARAQAEARARVARAAASLRAAQAQAAAANTSLEFALRERERLEPLLKGGQVSKAQYDLAAANAERGAAALESARAAIEVARYEKQAAETALRYAAGERGGGRVTVSAPVGGRVLEIQREDEGVVSAGTPVLSIGDLRSLEIVTEVLSVDAVRIRPGMAVHIDHWGGEARLEGRVRSVDPAAFTKVSALGVEEQRVKVVSDLTSPPEDWSTLGDAYRVQTRFVIADSAAVLRLPHSSLFRAGNDWAVYGVADGHIAQRTVRLGQRGLLYAEVLEGLAEGEQVVTYPDDTLAPGMRVRIRETETAD